MKDSRIKQINSWEQLNGLVSDDGQFFIECEEVLGEFCCAWIRPNISKEGHKFYLSTHSFYESQYKRTTKILQEHGFSVEIIPPYLKGRK